MDLMVVAAFAELASEAWKRYRTLGFTGIRCVVLYRTIVLHIDGHFERSFGGAVALILP